MLGILGRGQQHIKAIDPAGQLRGDGADGPVPARRDILGSAGGIGMHDRRQTKRTKPLAALRKPLGMAVHLDKRIKRRALGCQQMVIDPLEMLTIDEQPGFRKKMVNVGHASGDGIFHRHHGQRGTPFLYGKDHVLERGAGKHLHLRLHRLAGHMRIGAKHTLKGDDVAAVAHENRFPLLSLGGIPPAREYHVMTRGCQCQVL